MEGNDTFPNDSGLLVTDTPSSQSMEMVGNAAIGVVLSMCCLLTIVGNAMVLHAVRTEKKLQTVCNMFIVSLAIADLTVGLIVMPISAVYALSEDWPFGVGMCQFWIAVDYTASTASILNLFVLSLDRYWSVTNPLKYLSKRTRGRAIFLITMVWTASSFWIVPIVGWHHFVRGGIRLVPENVCDTEYATNTTLKIITSILNYFLPLTIMYALYTRIFIEIRNRSQLEIGQRVAFNGHAGNMGSSMSKKRLDSADSFSYEDYRSDGERGSSTLEMRVRNKCSPDNKELHSGMPARSVSVSACDRTKYKASEHLSGTVSAGQSPVVHKTRASERSGSFKNKTVPEGDENDTENESLYFCSKPQINNIKDSEKGKYSFRYGNTNNRSDNSDNYIKQLTIAKSIASRRRDLYRKTQSECGNFENIELSLDFVIPKINIEIANKSNDEVPEKYGCNTDSISNDFYIKKKNRFGCLVACCECSDYQGSEVSILQQNYNSNPGSPSESQETLPERQQQDEMLAARDSVQSTPNIENHSMIDGDSGRVHFSFTSGSDKKQECCSLPKEPHPFKCQKIKASMINPTHPLNRSSSTFSLGSDSALATTDFPNYQSSCKPMTSKVNAPKSESDGISLCTLKSPNSKRFISVLHKQGVKSSILSDKDINNCHKQISSSPLNKINHHSPTTKNNDLKIVKPTRSLRHSKPSSYLQKEIKAARQLGVIMGAFTVCFLPYFVCFTVVALCEWCVSSELMTVVTWIGYLNSTLNPFLYPLCNLNFRRKFREMLRFEFRRGRLSNCHSAFSACRKCIH